jgi:pimeloyl-ACP methyl ester carboxylesterase
LVKQRLLPAHRSAPALELLETEAADRGKPPILCLHGAFGGAWMWSEAFLPAAAALGRSATALSLRGHGNSHGRESLSGARLADYGQDVLRAIDALCEPPIIVAHSLGTLLAQRLLWRRPVRAVVLLAPLPPEGLLLLTPRLLVTVPELWLDIVDGLAGDRTVAFTHSRDAVRSSRCSAADLDRYLTLMVRESHLALLDCHVPVPIVPAFALGVPSLVLEAGEDTLVPRDAVMRTALYHGAEHRVVEGAGHLLHLERGAERVAQDVVEWLNHRGL